MSYIRQQVTDGSTIMNKFLYDNLQDGIDEALGSIFALVSAGIMSENLEEVQVGVTHTVQELFSRDTVTFFTNWVDYTDFPLRYGSGILMPTVGENIKTVLYIGGLSGGLTPTLYIGRVSSENNIWKCDWSTCTSTVNTVYPATVE